MSGRSAARRATVWVVVGACLLLAAGCGGDGARVRTDAVVQLKDFSLHLSTRRVGAGTVILGLQNAGPTVHELVVARTDRPSARLARARDGLSVDEHAADLHVIGEDDQVELGDVNHLAVHLTPGHYVLFCNLSGHYLGGMHADLVVTG